MPSEDLHLESQCVDSSRLLRAIEKVRLQKQRPSVERIHRVLRQLDPDLSMTDLSLELEKAAKDGIILKVVTNNVCSYKLLPPDAVKPRTSSLPVLRVLPGKEFLDAVVSLVSGVGRSSLETLESQLRKKYTLEITGDLNLRHELRDCCRKLVKLNRLRKDGLFFCLPSKEGKSMLDSTGSEAIWKKATICLQDCASSKATSMMPLPQPTDRRLEGKSRDRESGSGRMSSLGSTSGDDRFHATADSRPTNELPCDDPYSFHADPLLRSPVKGRQKSQTSLVKGDQVQPDTAQKRQRHREKSFENASSDSDESGSTGSPSYGKELASCDSTTFHRGRSTASSTLESQKTKPWQNDDDDWGRDSANHNSAGDENGAEEEEKPKKRSRSLQLAFLYDSLSKFFTASGEKRSAAHKAAQQSRLSASDNGVVRATLRSESALCREAKTLKTESGERRSLRENMRERPPANVRVCEKSKSTQLSAKPVSTAKGSLREKETCLKPASTHSKSGTSSVIFSSSLTDEDTRLFQVARTIAQERVLVSHGISSVPDIELKNSQTRVVFGKYEFVSTQKLPYPPEYSLLPRIFICEFCLKCCKTRTMLECHLRKCSSNRPPGEELYRENSLSVFEVHGSKEPLYCRNLVLFSHLFVDHPGLYCKVSHCLYYVTTFNDRTGSHFVGFFSKEKLGKHNLSCILVLPQHRGNGYGHFMVHLSYWLSSTDEIPKSPKAPLTEQARRVYRSVWKKAITDCIENEDLTEVTVKVLSCLTGIQDDDVMTTLCDLGLTQPDDSRQRSITLTPALREILQIKAEEKKRPIEFNSNSFLDSRLTRKLRGKPRPAKRKNSTESDSLVPSSAKRRCEAGKTTNDKSSIVQSDWNLTSKDVDLSPAQPPKRKVGWPKGVKRGTRKDKSVDSDAEDNQELSATLMKTESLDSNDDATNDHTKAVKDNDKKSDVEEVNVSTSSKPPGFGASTNPSFRQGLHSTSSVEEKDLESDNEGSMASEMPQLDEKEDDEAQNVMEFELSPSPPQLEQEVPSPYFCSGSLMRHGLEMGSKDAESVLSDCLAGRSVAPSPCFSIDEPRPRKDTTLTDDDSDEHSLDSPHGTEKVNDEEDRCPSVGVVTPSSPAERIDGNFEEARTSNLDDSLDENSLSSTGFSRSSSVESRSSLKAKSALESPGSVKAKLMSADSPSSDVEKPPSAHSPESPKGNPLSVASEDSFKCRSSVGGSPASIKDKLSSLESPASIGPRPSLAESPEYEKCKLSSVESPGSNKPQTVVEQSPVSIKDDSAKAASKVDEVEEVTPIRHDQSLGDRSDIRSPSDTGEDPLLFDRTSVVSMPPTPVRRLAEIEERRDKFNQITKQNCDLGNVFHESILPPITMETPCLRERVMEETKMTRVMDETKMTRVMEETKMTRVMEETKMTRVMEETKMTPKPSRESSRPTHAFMTSPSPVANHNAPSGHMSFSGHGLISNHGYVMTGQGSGTSLPGMNQGTQMMHCVNDVATNRGLHRYEHPELANAVEITRSHQPHHAVPKINHGLLAVENTLELSPAMASSTRTFPEPVAHPSVLMGEQSPQSFHLQNGLPSRTGKAGAAGSNSHGSDLPSNVGSGSRASASRQTMSGNNSMGHCSISALSPGFMNSMVQSPLTKGMGNSYGSSKSMAMMNNRSTGGRQNASQVPAAGGSFGHQQVPKQMMPNKYNKAPTPNVQLQNLSPCGLYGLPKSSPSSGVPQGMSNSSPSANYTIGQNLSPGSGDCGANSSFHNLAHNRNLINASPAPSCSGKQYGRHLQHGNSRGFNNSSSAARAASPPPKPTGANALYQVPPSQNITPSPHQIQTPAPYVQGAVQRHIGDQFSSDAQSFSRQQGYMFQATYLAKLQQLTNDLSPFQTHYAMAIPPNMSPSPIDMTLQSHASPQRNMTPPNVPTQRLNAKQQQVHRGNGTGQHKAASSAVGSAASFLPDVPSSDMIARYQLISGYHVQQPMTCPSFIHQGSPSQIPMQVGMMNVGVHAGQPSPNFMPAVQGQPNSAVYAAYGYINSGLTPQPFNMNLNDLMRR